MNGLVRGIAIVTLAVGLVASRPMSASATTEPPGTPIVGPTIGVTTDLLRAVTIEGLLPGSVPASLTQLTFAPSGMLDLEGLPGPAVYLVTAGNLAVL